MLDYRLVEAFAAVIGEGGFEKAGQRLGLTQSAVSQRVRNLEELAGTILVVRETPPRATPTGLRILRHFVQVQALEQEAFGSALPGADDPLGSGFSRITLAVNGDSLATWFLGAIGPYLAEHSLLVDIKVDDQSQTINYLRSGEAMACISARQESVTGCVSQRLGSMEYRLCAAPRFRDRWFPEGYTREAAARAPIIHCTPDDDLQKMALANCFGDEAPAPPAHYIPSTEQIFQAVLSGFSYCMIPEIQAAAELEKGTLVELAPEGRVWIDLYWHRWSLTTAVMDEFEAEVFRNAGQSLARV